MNTLQTRGSGRTTEQLRKLKPGRTVFVVHTPALVHYVAAIVVRLNRADGGGRNVTCLPIQRAGDAEALNGLDCPIVVDHAFWGAPATPEVAQLVRGLLDGRQEDEPAPAAAPEPHACMACPVEVRDLSACARNAVSAVEMAQAGTGDWSRANRKLADLKASLTRFQPILDAHFAGAPR